MADAGRAELVKVKFPDAAFVELSVFIPSLGKSATITRKVSAPRKPKIVPADPDVKAALEEIADHPEITLSRREIRSQGVAADRGSCRRTQRRISELTRLPKALQEELTCQSTSVAFDMSLARSRKRLVED